MGWGGGWGDHASTSAREVAEAFYAGKKRARSSCRTDGETYWFLTENRQIPIARRVRDEDRLDNITSALQGGQKRPLLEFSTAGYRTKTTARHFCALGLDAVCRGVKSARFSINGRFIPDDWFGWFTLEDVKAWPAEHPDDTAKQLRAKEREEARRWRMGREFVQMTAPLPF